MDVNEVKNKKSENIKVIFGVILVLCVFIGWLYIFIKDNSKRIEKDNINLNDQEIKKLINDNYFETLKGLDIIDTGVNEQSKLILAAKKYTNENDDKIIDVSCSELFKDDSNAKLNDGIYNIKDGNMEFDCEDTIEFIEYEPLNKTYKEMFNSEASKINVNQGTASYYYSKKLNGYAIPLYYIGCTTCCKHAFNIKEYNVVDGKLVVSINYLTFTMDYNNDKTDNEKYGFTATMDKDKTLVYKTDGDNFEPMINDVVKNHNNLVDVYNFIFKIDGNNYYLEDIKKAN